MMNNEQFSEKLSEHLSKEMERRAEAKKQQTIETARVVRDRMNRLIETLEANGNPNSLGELQGLGSEVDRLVGELCMMHETAKNIFSDVRFARVMIELYGE